MKEIIFYPFCKIFDSLIRPKAVPVLLYHSISDAPSRLAVPIKNFSAQMAWLAGQGYQTIRPADLASDEPGKAKRVLLTFDDGFKDNLANALPVLEKYGFFATVFISTAYLGKTSSFCRRPEDQNFPMLNADDLRTLKNSGWTIASHFASHRDLDNLPAREVRREYEEARSALAATLGDPAAGRIVSYPHNRYNEKVATELKRSGALMAFSGRIGFFAPGDDLYRIPRVEIDRDVNLKKFKLFLSPSYNWLKNKFYQRK